MWCWRAMLHKTYFEKIARHSFKCCCINRYRQGGSSAALFKNFARTLWLNKHGHSYFIFKLTYPGTIYFNSNLLSFQIIHLGTMTKIGGCAAHGFRVECRTLKFSATRRNFEMRLFGCYSICYFIYFPAFHVDLYFKKIFITEFLLSVCEHYKILSRTSFNVFYLPLRLIACAWWGKRKITSKR